MLRQLSRTTESHLNRLICQMQRHSTMSDPVLVPPQRTHTHMHPDTPPTGRLLYTKTSPIWVTGFADPLKRPPHMHVPQPRSIQTTLSSNPSGFMILLVPYAVSQLLSTSRQPPIFMIAHCRGPPSSVSVCLSACLDWLPQRNPRTLSAPPSCSSVHHCIHAYSLPA